MNMGNSITLASSMNIKEDCSGNRIEQQKNIIIEPPNKTEESPKINIMEREVIKIPDRELMEKLENRGMDKVADLWNKGKQFDINSLTNIMKEGTDEFKKKEGRNMTYSEMRSLYG
jgi:hypothetical protein